jgi:hypothetical protein
MMHCPASKTTGRLTILQGRMNPDLAMGDELLKKTGSGNLLMVFGEPDIEVKPTDDGRLTLEIHTASTSTTRAILPSWSGAPSCRWPTGHSS